MESLVLEHIERIEALALSKTFLQSAIEASDIPGKEQIWCALHKVVTVDGPILRNVLVEVAQLNAEVARKTAMYDNTYAALGEAQSKCVGLLDQARANKGHMDQCEQQLLGARAKVVELELTIQNMLKAACEWDASGLQMSNSIKELEDEVSALKKAVAQKDSEAVSLKKALAKRDPEKKGTRLASMLVFIMKPFQMIFGRQAR